MTWDVCNGLNDPGVGDAFGLEQVCQLKAKTLVFVCVLMSFQNIECMFFSTQLITK